MAIHPDAVPAMCYVGLCMLVTDVSLAQNLMQTNEALASLTRDIWLRLASSPFALCSPSLTVPAIRAACESNKKGLALAATILLAADGAITLKRSGSVHTQLKNLAEQIV